MTPIKDLLIELRDMKLSQSEIARRTGIPQPTLSKWQAGKAPRSADQAIDLIKFHAEQSKRAKRRAKVQA